MAFFGQLLYILAIKKQFSPITLANQELIP